VLTRMRPIPDGVVDAMLNFMQDSDQVKYGIISIIGHNHIDDPKAIAAVMQMLESHLPGDVVDAEHPAINGGGSLRPNNTGLVQVAQCLEHLGPSAKSALSSLRMIVASHSDRYDQQTREFASQAIRAIEKSATAVR
jgi:hypothetical protein